MRKKNQWCGCNYCGFQDPIIKKISSYFSWNDYFKMYFEIKRIIIMRKLVHCVYFYGNSNKLIWYRYIKELLKQTYWRSLSTLPLSILTLSRVTLSKVLFSKKNLIDFLDELGNFKQKKILHFWFLHFQKLHFQKCISRCPLPKTTFFLD